MSGNSIRRAQFNPNIFIIAWHIFCAGLYNWILRNKHTIIFFLFTSVLKLKDWKICILKSYRYTRETIESIFGAIICFCITLFFYICFDFMRFTKNEHWNTFLECEFFLLNPTGENKFVQNGQTFLSNRRASRFFAGIHRSFVVKNKY